jgi:hypothetical protein
MKLLYRNITAPQSKAQNDLKACNNKKSSCDNKKFRMPGVV